MAKVWINPAFKDKVPRPEKRKESRPFKRDDKRKKPVNREKRRPAPIQYTPPDPLLELKFLHDIKEKDIPIQAVLVDGTEFKGKIKWFSEWSIALEVEGRQSEVIFNRLKMIYYSQLKDNRLSEEEIEKLPDPDVKKTEISTLQDFKNNKNPLVFYMKNNVQVKGTLDWFEKLVYHVKSLDGTKDYNLYKNSVIFFERVAS